MMASWFSRGLFLLGSLQALLGLAELIADDVANRREMFFG